jgi:hypothetical protein
MQHFSFPLPKTKTQAIYYKPDTKIFP